MSVVAQKATFFFWQNILKNRSKYRGDISEQSVVCTVLISTIIIEIFRKNIPISYIIPYKNLASPLIPVCLMKSHMKCAHWRLRSACVSAQSDHFDERSLGSHLPKSYSCEHRGKCDQTARIHRLICVFNGVIHIILYDLLCPGSFSSLQSESARKTFCTISQMLKTTKLSLISGWS